MSEAQGKSVRLDHNLCCQILGDSDGKKVKTKSWGGMETGGIHDRFRNLSLKK